MHIAPHTCSMQAESINILHALGIIKCLLPSTLQKGSVVHSYPMHIISPNSDLWLESEPVGRSTNMSRL